MHYTGGVTCMCVCCADIFRLLTACLYYDLVVSLCGAQNRDRVALSGRHALDRYVLNVALSAQGCRVVYATYNKYPPPLLGFVNRVSRVFVFVFRVAARPFVACPFHDELRLAQIKQ